MARLYGFSALWQGKAKEKSRKSRGENALSWPQIARRLDRAAMGGVLRPKLRAFRHVRGTPMTAAFTFPGQGSQALGMGKALADAFPAAKAVFDEVDAALGEKLSAII